MLESRPKRVASIALGFALLAFERLAVAVSPSCEPAQRFSLENGVEVVLVPETGLPTVALVSSVHAGFRNDPSGHEGLAHYVEHLTFLGTPAFAPAFDLYQEVGAIGVNATTSADTTDYFALVPAAQVERAIWIEARRLGIGVSPPTEEQALAERQVLLREHAVRFGYVPSYSLVKATYEALYPPGHPYHASFASEGSIEKLTLGDARWFFAQHYRTDQTRLVLVGDFVAEVAKGLVEKHFGALARGPAPAEGGVAEGPGACRWEQVPRDVARSRIVQHTRSRNERLELFWPVAPGENTEALRMLFSALRGDLTEALQQTGLSHWVSGELVDLELGAFWSLQIEVAPGQPFEELERLVARVLEDAGANFASEHDVVAKRQVLELSEVLARERLLARALGLAHRACTASACVDPSKYVTGAAVGNTGRFALSSALVVERRYSIGASADGDLEVVR